MGVGFLGLGFGYWVFGSSGLRFRVWVLSLGLSGSGGVVAKGLGFLPWDLGSDHRKMHGIPETAA